MAVKEARFCMAEAHGGRGFPPSPNAYRGMNIFKLIHSDHARKDNILLVNCALGLIHAVHLNI